MFKLRIQNTSIKKLSNIYKKLLIGLIMKCLWVGMYLIKKKHSLYYTLIKDKLVKYTLSHYNNGFRNAVIVLHNTISGY